MSEYNTVQMTEDEQAGLRKYVNKVFLTMGAGVSVTAIVSFLGYYLLATEILSLQVYAIALPIALIAELAICFILSRKITELATSTANMLFYTYAAVTGVTFAVLFVNINMETVFAAFAYSAVMFFSCAVIGLTTKVDLTKFKGMIFGALIALILATILSFFVPVLRDSLLLSYIGVVLFLVITAYDMQKIKEFYYGTQGGYGQIGNNLAIYGAFQLYLDFINIFIKVLSILSSRSNRK